MNIYDFMGQYCRDITNKHNASKTLLDVSGYPCDAVVDAPDGRKVPIVYIDDTPVPVSDFLTMERVEFISVHKLQSAAQTYDNYLAYFIILEGEDALHRIRNAVKAEKEELERVNLDILEEL